MKTLEEVLAGVENLPMNKAKATRRSLDARAKQARELLDRDRRHDIQRDAHVRRVFANSIGIREIKPSSIIASLLKDLAPRRKPQGRVTQDAPDIGWEMMHNP